MRRDFAVVLSTAWLLIGAAWVTAAEAETPMIDIPNAVVIQNGVLGGGQPDENALRRAADMGYRTIVNTRLPGEEGSLDNEDEFVRSLGMQYIALPTRGSDTFNEPNAKRLAEILEDPDALPVMVHCASGNRVGILFAVKAFYVDGLDGPAALDLGTRSGARRIPVEVKTLLSGESDD